MEAYVATVVAEFDRQQAEAREQSLAIRQARMLADMQPMTPDQMRQRAADFLSAPGIPEE